MWIIYCSTVLSLVTVSFCADHDTFKNCSRVDFCNNLRNRVPSNDYTVDPTSISGSSESNTLTATLKSTSGGADLTLTLSGLQQSTFRLKITEVDANRYELKDVLDGEPQGLNFDNVAFGDGTATVTTGSNSAKINFSPLSIEFSKNGVVEVVFDGDLFSISRNSETAPFTLGVEFPDAIQLYGIHEHCQTVALPDTKVNGGDPFRLKNSDVAYYEIDSPMALYGAIPVLYGQSPTSTSGIFLHNAAEQWIDITNGDNKSQAYFMVEIGTLDLFVFLGPKPVDVVRQYTALTGTAHLPQLWTLGYHQSRYSYETQDDVKFVVSNFDSNDFQLDAIWLDIDYTDGFKYFTWNPENFSDPVGLQDIIASTGKHLITIIDPHIKVEDGYNVYDGGIANDLFVKNPDGTVFQGQCWPGLSSYMDFLNPAARDFYGSMYWYDNFTGSTPTLGGTWNDMNEPSVFDNSIEMTLPANGLHIGNVRHREIHNIYGFLHTMATHQGLLQRDNGEKRPFVLTRSHFAGSQRYAAFWTGDNAADWPYLHAAFKECLTANILGMVFCGADIGGFFDNPSDELLERWYQAGAWLPFFRSHSTKDTNRREPYVLPEDSQVVVRNAMQTRYKHLPVWYTLFYEHTVTGDPIIRPLFYEYPEDVDVYGIDDELLVGKDILVKAIVNPGVESVDVYFPGGEDLLWFSANGDDVQAGVGVVNVPAPRDYTPVYYRRGAVILRKDTVRRNTGEMVNDTYSAYFAVNEDGTANGTLYIDDGLSFRYRDDSDYSYFLVEANGDEISLTPIGGNRTFEFAFDKVVRKEIIKKPESGKPGTYKETVFKTDASGRLLKDIKISLKKKITLRLK